MFFFLVHYRYNVEDPGSSEEDDQETQSNDIEASDQEETVSIYSSVYSSVEETSVDSDGDSESGQVSKVEDDVPCAEVSSPDKDCEPSPRHSFISEVQQGQADKIAQPQEEVHAPVVVDDAENSCVGLELTTLESTSFQTPRLFPILESDTAVMNANIESVEAPSLTTLDAITVFENEPASYLPIPTPRLQENILVVPEEESSAVESNAEAAKKEDPKGPKRSRSFREGEEDFEKPPKDAKKKPKRG